MATGSVGGLRRTLRAAGRLVILSLAGVGLITIATFAVSPNVFNTFKQQFSYYYGKLFGYEYIMVGDSIIAGGQNWGEYLSVNPFIAVTRGTNGYTLEQVRLAVEVQAAFRPERMVVLAGTNNILRPDIAAATTRDELERLIATLCTQPFAVILNTVPPTRTAAANRDIALFNRQLREAVGGRLALLDLNALLQGQDGLLRAEYSGDGVHLTPAAYRVWGEAIAEMHGMDAIPRC